MAEMILGDDPDAYLSRSCRQYGDLSSEVKSELCPMADNVRYSVRVGRTKGIATTYWRETYRNIDMARVIDAVELLKGRGIRGGHPNSRSIKCTLLSKPPEYIEKSAKRQ